MPLKDNYIELAKKFGGPYTLTKKGVKKSIVDSIMRGSCPKADELLPIAQVLSSSIEELLTGKAQKEIPPKAGEGPDDYDPKDRFIATELPEMLHNFNRLDDFDKRRVIHSIDALLKEKGMKYEKLFKE